MTNSITQPEAVQDDINTMLNNLLDIDTSTMCSNQIFRLANLTDNGGIYYKEGATRTMEEHGHDTDKLTDHLIAFMNQEYPLAGCQGDSGKQCRKQYASYTNSIQDAGKVAFPIDADADTVEFDGFLAISFKPVGSKKKGEIDKRTRGVTVEFITQREALLLAERAQVDADLQAERDEQDKDVADDKATAKEEAKQAERDNAQPAEIWEAVQGFLAENYPHCNMHGLVSYALDSLADDSYTLADDTDDKATGTNG